MEEPLELKAEFERCPNCGSTKSLAREAAKYMKAKGWALEDFNYYTHIVRGFPQDKRVVGKIPIGSSVPVIWGGMDICLECGITYARKIIATKAQFSIGPPGKFPPDFKISGN